MTLSDRIPIVRHKDIIYGFILAAIVMLTVLAWKDLLEYYINNYIKDEESSIKWKWVYAGLMTSAFIIMNRYFQIESIS